MEDEGACEDGFLDRLSIVKAGRGGYRRVSDDGLRGGGRGLGFSFDFGEVDMV